MGCLKECLWWGTETFLSLLDIKHRHYPFSPLTLSLLCSPFFCLSSLVKFSPLPLHPEDTLQRTSPQTHIPPCTGFTETPLPQRQEGGTPTPTRWPHTHTGDCICLHQQLVKGMNSSFFQKTSGTEQGIRCLPGDVHPSLICGTTKRWSLKTCHITQEPNTRTNPRTKMKNKLTFIFGSWVLWSAGHWNVILDVMVQGWEAFGRWVGLEEKDLSETPGAHQPCAKETGKTENTCWISGESWS